MAKAMKKTRGTPARRKRVAKKAAPDTTALVPQVEVIPTETDDIRRAVSAGILIGRLGLVETQLTPEEEAVLSREVNERHVLIKPVKQPTPYLPHIRYTQWFNEAFGRLGWAVVPVGEPKLEGKSIVVPYVLYIHGLPCKFAYGEQDYFPNNDQQTYGDAVESTQASALRRLAKRLGVGLELWDRGWVEDFIERHGKLVQVKKKNGDTEWVWRRKDDKPFYNEVGREERRQPPPQERAQERPAPRETVPPAGSQKTPPPAGRNTDADLPITEAQWMRLRGIAKRAGRTAAEMALYLQSAYGIDSAQHLKRKDYDDVCRAVESPRPLPMGGRP